jgi:lipoprotein-anchoring transpeptidase ErfK/SrfK
MDQFMLQISLRGLRRATLVPALLAVALLAGCVESTVTGATSGPAAPPAGKIDDTVYAAQKDGSVTLPAVPAEKVPDQFQRQTVRYESDQPKGTIIVDPAQKFLYFITGNNTAIRYGIGVGRAGYEWSGEAIVADKKPYPTWYPPKEMIARKPELAKWANGQPGGPNNPLGARALYLTSGGKDYGYRIHGSPEWWTIGKNASSGCIRMIHQDVIDLFNRAEVGAKVIVLTADSKFPTKLTLPSPHVDGPAPAKAVAKAAEVPAAAIPALVVLPTPAVATGTSPTAAATAATGSSPAPAASKADPVCDKPLVDGACPKDASGG